MGNRTWNCVSQFLQIALAFYYSVWQKRTLLRRWQHIDQQKMRCCNTCVSLIAAMTAALAPLDAGAGGPLVDVQSVDPTIMVELRCAGRNNLIRHPLYRQGTRALARPEVASALAVAQAFLRRYQCGLKIWDAYRPAAVQAELWKASRNSDYVANPGIGVGSL